MESNRKFKKFGDRTSKGNEKKKLSRLHKKKLGVLQLCSSYVRAATSAKHCLNLSTSAAVKVSAIQNAENFA